MSDPIDELTFNEDDRDMNDNGSVKGDDDSAVSSVASSAATTPRKERGAAAPDLSASPARSSAVTIVGGGKRRRLLSASGLSAFGGEVPPSPPKFASLDEIMKAAAGVKNMALAHEIAVDKDFKIEKADFPPTSFEGTVKSMMHKAFWDLMKERLNEDPPDYESAVSVFEDIKNLLDNILLPQHQRLKQQIEEVLDMQLIRQQVDNGTIDVYSYTDFVLTIMSKLCAPVRDDNIAELRQQQNQKGDLITLFKGILETLELMKIDMANFTIQQMRPFIQSQSVEYEKTKFAAFLETQTDGLALTRVWLTEVLKTLEGAEGEATASAAGATASPSPTPPPTPATILVEAFVSLLSWDETRPFPETLLMDEGRLLLLRDKFYRISLVGATLLVVYNAIGSPIAGLGKLKEDLKSKIQILLGPLPGEDQDSKEPILSAPFSSDKAAVQSHKSLLKEKMAQIFETVKSDVGKSLTAHGYPAPPDTLWDSLRGQVTNLESSTDHPIVQIVLKRLAGFVKKAMSMEAKDPVQIPPGLSGLQKEIVDLVATFMRIVTHNRAVFGDYYQDIIQTLIKPRPPSA